MLYLYEKSSFTPDFDGSMKYRHIKNEPKKIPSAETLKHSVNNFPKTYCQYEESHQKEMKNNNKRNSKWPKI